VDVGFSTRVTEAYMFQIEATADFASEYLLLSCIATNIHAYIVKHISNSRDNDRVGMPIESSCELAGEICITI
jgi:hypothetical protein